jgi:predicted RNA-binding Zn ribbon-like protein
MTYEIELVGNALCLDLANTVNVRPVASRDWLGTLDDASGWARAVGRPLDRPVTEPELREAHAMREVVFRVFQPLAHGERSPSSDLDALAGIYSAAVGASRLRWNGGGYVLAWTGPRTFRTLCWEAAVSAVDLLRAGPLDRLGECPSCSWLFLDTSKNRRRRWCSMATCGSRDKARRYYERHAG